jgi:hypothetical protein
MPRIIVKRAASKLFILAEAVIDFYSTMSGGGVHSGTHGASQTSDKGARYSSRWKKNQSLRLERRRADRRSCIGCCAYSIRPANSWLAAIMQSAMGKLCESPCGAFSAQGAALLGAGEQMRQRRLCAIFRRGGSSRHDSRPRRFDDIWRRDDIATWLVLDDAVDRLRRWLFRISARRFRSATPAPAVQGVTQMAGSATGPPHV